MATTTNERNERRRTESGQISDIFALSDEIIFNKEIAAHHKDVLLKKQFLEKSDAKRRILYDKITRLPDEQAVKVIANLMPKLTTHQEKIALCLSGGANRGISHVGVLKALKDLNIPIHSIFGSSAGSFVSAIFILLGYDDLILMSDNDRIYKIFKFKPTLEELFDSHHLETNTFDYFLDHDITFRDLHKLSGTNIFITTTNLHTGKLVLFGNDLDERVWDAVRASASVPGVWKPHHYVKDGKEMILVDGSLSRDVPEELARIKGADFVFSSNVNVYNGLLHNRYARRFKELFTKTSLGEVNAYLWDDLFKVKNAVVRGGMRKNIVNDVVSSAMSYARNFGKHNWGTTSDVEIIPDLSLLEPLHPDFSTINAFFKAGYVATTRKRELIVKTVPIVRLINELGHVRERIEKSRVRSK